jgi:hypothetical protein
MKKVLNPGMEAASSTKGWTGTGTLESGENVRFVGQRRKIKDFSTEERRSAYWSISIGGF